MAKGKHAAALFEVIQTQRKSERTGSSSARAILRTPKWWFNARRRLRSMTSGAAAVTPAFGMSSGGGSSDRVSEASLPYAAAATAPASLNRGSAFAFRMDPDRQQISVRVSYTTGVVATFSLVVLIGLAYMAGRNIRPSPMPMLSSLATEQIRQLPAQPGVLDIGNGSATTSSATTTSQSVEKGAEAASIVRELPKVAPTFNDPRPPATVVVQDDRRHINTNYVVIQSYPDEKMAKEAIEILAKAGIPATVERGIKGWSSNLYLVVGTHGFNRISSPEYRAYLKKIEDVSDQYAGKRSFKAFQPIAKKWDVGS